MTSARGLCKCIPLQPPHNTHKTDGLSWYIFASQTKLALKHVINVVNDQSIWAVSSPSSTYRKKQFNEVHNRTSQKGSGSYDGQNSWQCSSFL